MALFRNDRLRVHLESPVRIESPVHLDGPVPVVAKEVELTATRPPWSLWADGFGRIAIRAVQIIVVVIVGIGLVYAVRSLTVVTIPMMIALILASAFNPVMRAMRSRGVPSLAATLLTLLGIVVILGLLGWLIVWAVRDQWDELATQAQDGFDQLVVWAQGLPFDVASPEQIDQWMDQLTDFLTSAQFGSGAIAGVGAVANFLTGLVLMVVTLFFFLKDGAKMWEFLLRPFRGQSYSRARRIGDRIVTTLGSYVRGTAAVAAVDAIGILIGLLILRVPLAIPLAVLVFLLAFIPIVGATLAGILAALVALVTNGLTNALIVVGVVVLVNQLEGNLLQPVLMGRSMKLHAFVILIALTIGTVLGGIVGAVLAVPLTAALWGAINVWDGPDTPPWWARAKITTSD
ncbi:AI-2E family transporter [Aestuariimicrobium sp. Y1814]|uniref:AI-2E family transporter n=1 Tax=Aestuariimicrobium sp. Y1814 TaxID=3418742 RepID=UPI003DA6EF0A